MIKIVWKWRWDHMEQQLLSERDKADRFARKAAEDIAAHKRVIDAQARLISLLRNDIDRIKQEAGIIDD